MTGDLIWLRCISGPHIAGKDAEKVRQLLLDSIAAPEDGRRLAAVHWAGKLYGFGDVPARYIGVLAAGDAKLEGREAGLASLQPPKAPKGVLQVHACRRWHCLQPAGIAVCCIGGVRMTGSP